LQDIEYSSESDDPEEILHLKRQPHTVLTEENMRTILNDETEKLNLEACYWIKPQFITKIGKMAPNLSEISFRRMTHITNPDFAEVF
jgi:hypothetical protein